tara:strand:- start:280 stop:2757 length:2478 start_codon:yes stop_codon:yes gene_type:complete
MNIFNKYLIYFLLILITIILLINYKLKENFYINNVEDNCPARVKLKYEKCVNINTPEYGDIGNTGRKGRVGITGNDGDTGLKGKNGKNYYKLGFIKFFDNLTKNLISTSHSPNLYSYNDKTTNVNILRGDDGDNAVMFPINFKDRESNNIIKEYRNSNTLVSNPIDVFIPKGDKGPPGINPKCFFDIEKKGPTGKPGPRGYPGPQGLKGLDGEDGEPGIEGQKNKSPIFDNIHTEHICITNNDNTTVYDNTIKCIDKTSDTNCNLLLHNTDIPNRCIDSEIADIIIKKAEIIKKELDFEKNIKTCYCDNGIPAKYYEGCINNGEHVCKTCGVGYYLKDNKCIQCQECAKIDTSRVNCNGTNPGTCIECVNCPNEDQYKIGCKSKNKPICKYCDYNSVELNHYLKGCSGKSMGVMSPCIIQSYNTYKKNKESSNTIISDLADKISTITTDSLTTETDNNSNDIEDTEDTEEYKYWVTCDPKTGDPEYNDCSFEDVCNDKDKADYYVKDCGTDEHPACKGYCTQRKSCNRPGEVTKANDKSKLNSDFNDLNICVCDKNYQYDRDKNICTECPDNSTKNTISNDDKCECNENYEYDTNTGLCNICPNNSIKNTISNTDKCKQCNRLQYKEGNRCVSKNGANEEGTACIGNYVDRGDYCLSCGDYGVSEIDRNRCKRWVETGWEGPYGEHIGHTKDGKIKFGWIVSNNKRGNLYTYVVWGNQVFQYKDHGDVESTYFSETPWILMNNNRQLYYKFKAGQKWYGGDDIDCEKHIYPPISLGDPNYTPNQSLYANIPNIGKNGICRTDGRGRWSTNRTNFYKIYRKTKYLE